MTKKREPPKMICEYSGCDNPIALTLLNKEGRHNFVPHIINGEQKTVCIACKIKLLQNKQRNGF